MTQTAPAQTISQPATDPSAFDCILGNIFGFMLPFSMKRDARIMMAAFSKNDTRSSTTIPTMIDPAASAAAAARAAIATAKRT